MWISHFNKWENGNIYYDKKHLYRDTDFRGKKNALLDT